MGGRQVRRAPGSQRGPARGPRRPGREAALCPKGDLQALGSFKSEWPEHADSQYDQVPRAISRGPGSSVRWSQEASSP